MISHSTYIFLIHYSIVRPLFVDHHFEGVFLLLFYDTRNIRVCVYVCLCVSSLLQLYRRMSLPPRCPFPNIFSYTNSTRNLQLYTSGLFVRSLHIRSVLFILYVTCFRPLSPTRVLSTTHT